MNRKFSISRAATRRYAFRLFLSSIIILMLALSASLLIYTRAADAIGRENQKTNYYMLTELARTMDERVMAASSLLLTMEKDETLQQHVLRERNHGKLGLSEAYDMYKRMKSLYQSQYSDIFIYFRLSGRVVSGRYANGESGLYFRTYYGGTNMNTDTLDSLIAQGCTQYAFSCGDGAFALAQALPFTNEQLRAPSAIAVAVFDKTALSRYLASGANTGRALSIFSQDGRMLLSSFPGGAGETYERDGRRFAKSGGREYLTQAWQSPDTGLSYTMFTDAEILYESALSLRRASFIIFAIFLAGGLIVAFAVMRSNYKPIGKLVNEVIDKRPAASEMLSQGEIPCIRHVLLSALDERERHAGVLRAGFTGRALQGLADQTEDVVQKFGEYGVSLVSDRFLIYTLRVEYGAEERSRTELERRVDAAFSQALSALSSPHTGMLISHHSGLFSYLLNLSEECAFDAERAARDFQAAFARGEGGACTVAAGREMRGWEGLRKSYMDSIQAMDARAVFGPGSFIPCDPEGMRAFRYQTPRPEDAEKGLIACVRQQTPAPEEFLRNYQREATGGEIALPAEFRLYAHDLFELVNSAREPLGATDEDLKALSEPDNLPDFERAFSELIDSLSRRWRETEQSVNDKNEDEMCARVTEYILQNLSDAAMCTESIGKAFSISGAYLSKRYKNRTLQTLSAAIADARVKRVRALLIDTDEGLDAIASMVGLIDASALIRVFKKAEGVTPGEYRKLYKTGGKSCTT